MVTCKYTNNLGREGKLGRVCKLLRNMAATWFGEEYIQKYESREIDGGTGYGIVGD
jgi:hypothetical protein